MERFKAKRCDSSSPSSFSDVGRDLKVEQSDSNVLSLSVVLC